MDFPTIRDFVCAKVGKTDDYSKARCLDYVTSRDKMIYESADWKVAQIIVEKTISPAGGPTKTISVPEVHHTLAIRLDGNLLDPVTSSYIFENATEDSDSYATPGTPLFFDEFFNIAAGTRNIRFYPPLFDDGTTAHTLVVLGKQPYVSTGSPNIPQTESALIAFVIGDMWEYLHQVGKGQAKFQEANGLLQEAQKADTPSALRPRMSHTTTPTGNSLGELAFSVCDIIGDFTPPVRDSVRDRIRRTYQMVWDSFLWPESTIVASVKASGKTAILPFLIDKVIGVRINLSPSATPTGVKTIYYEDSAIYFGMQPDIFDNTGEPISYNLMLPVALPVNLNPQSFLYFIFGIQSGGLGGLQAQEVSSVFIKGEASGAEVYETVIVNANVPTQSTLSYDTVYTIHKPVTLNALNIQDVSAVRLDQLFPAEEERKYQRIRIYPGFDSTDPTIDQTVFVLGKRVIAQLRGDGDTCQLSGIENILINTAAADMLIKQGKADIAQALSTKADSALKALMEKETGQSAYRPRVLPYAEQPSMSIYCDNSFLGTN